MSRKRSESSESEAPRKQVTNVDPSKGPIDVPLRNPRAERGRLIQAGEPARPDVKLATMAEAHTIATQLMESGLVVGDVRMHDAEPDSGMPLPSGDYRPLLLTFTDTHPVTVQAVTFHVPAGILAVELGKFPQGEWYLEHDDRMVKRRPV